MSKRTLTVTFPDGTTATRKTERHYTHVIAVFSVSHGQTKPTWGAWSWTTRPDVEIKAARRNVGEGPEIRALAL